MRKSHLLRLTTILVGASLLDVFSSACIFGYSCSPSIALAEEQPTSYPFKVTYPTPGLSLSNNRPVVSGTAQSESLVELHIDGIPRGRTLTNARGEWRVQVGRGNFGSMKIESDSFSSWGSIPQRHSLDAGNVSPYIKWENTPSGARSFALFVDDPDAPGYRWTHWIIFDIPEHVRSLSENSGAPQVSLLPPGTRMGRNSWGDHNQGAGDYYQGPKPPPGQNHRYFFRLYALSTAKLDLPEKLPTRAEVEKAMQGLIVGEGELVGFFPEISPPDDDNDLPLEPGKHKARAVARGPGGEFKGTSEPVEFEVLP